MDNLEAVGSLLLERTKADFVLYNAFFTVGCGQSGKKNASPATKILLNYISI